MLKWEESTPQPPQSIAIDRNVQQMVMALPFCDFVNIPDRHIRSASSSGPVYESTDIYMCLKIEHVSNGITPISCFLSLLSAPQTPQAIQCVHGPDRGGILRTEQSGKKALHKPLKQLQSIETCSKPQYCLVVDVPLFAASIFQN